MFDIYQSPLFPLDKITDQFTNTRHTTPISCKKLARDFYRWLAVNNYPLESQKVQDWYQKMDDCVSSKFR